MLPQSPLGVFKKQGTDEYQLQSQFLEKEFFLKRVKQIKTHLALKKRMRLLFCQERAGILTSHAGFR
jgi:hypothetical protein